MKVRCPVCRKSCEWEDNPFRPFCGERCRVLDLGDWAEERFRIASDPISEEESTEPEEPWRN